MNLIKLKSLREKRNMTYQEVADMAGLSKEHYWMIENGRRGLTYPTAIKIAKVFNKRPDDIFLNSELTCEEHDAI